ncbi:hypothetical protein DFQ28_008233 [Apophysomyces sp. BC1034]|nr:hypothetical protein DFQ30_007772 [Apophysomyces sp. BC1015]KAG0175286.1 hypothetical protein DFQ29_007200 [Apophysomyces sp. BC1021]KAG0186165.1 hypothetical protein DFQ28_008233 [Apophysomyces sp. BC1034]
MNNQQGAILQRQEKTPKQQHNIANLYSQLQAAIDKAQYSRRPTSLSHLRRRKTLECDSMSEARSSTSSDTASSSTNSPITPHHTTDLLNMCSCKHWLVSSDSEHCSICDERLPMLTSWQHERTSRSKTIKENKAELKRLSENQQRNNTEIQKLEKRCEDRQLSLDKCVSDLESLKHDLKILHSKYIDEMSQIEEIQRSKESVKRELEDLSQRLFEEANGMVVVEKQEKRQLQIIYDELQKQLQEAEEALDKAETDLQSLREEMTRLGEQGEDQQQTEDQALREISSDCKNDVFGETLENCVVRAQVDLALIHAAPLQVQIDATEDSQLLAEFEQFTDIIGTISIRKLHSLRFMKHCLREDIEPCLRFGPNPRMTSKKIVEAILVKTCLVEECPAGFVDEQAEKQRQEEVTASLWERFAYSPAFRGCGACGRKVDSTRRENVLSYRFRISYFDEWSCIDRYCRDRLVAVIEFYTFLRHLRLGSYRDRALVDLYQECTRLRLQMFLSRLGILASTLQGIGYDPSAIGRASIGLSADTNNRTTISEDASYGRSSSSTESTATTASSTT